MIYLYLFCSYILGSIPFSHIVARKSGVDILNEGSGNPGATNVARTVGYLPGLIVLLLDVLKGFLPLYFFNYFKFDLSLDTEIFWHYSAGFSAIFGHVVSPFLKFRGGKGVAATIGVFLYIAPLPIGIGIAIFAILLPIWRIVSIGTLAGISSLPITIWIFKRNDPNFLPVFLLSILTFLLIFFAHRSNIMRLINNSEHRF